MNQLIILTITIINVIYAKRLQNEKENLIREYSEQDPNGGKTLKFVFSVFRHGARAPYDNIVNQRDLFGEKWEFKEELTPVGMRMHYLLGHANYLRYKDLIGDSYSRRHIETFSTDVNRTIQSGLSHLNGLFPHGTGKKLSNEQQNEALPPVKVPNLDDVLGKLGNNALPKQANVFALSQFNVKDLYFSFEFGHCSGLANYLGENINTTVTVKMMEEFNSTHGGDLINALNLTDPITFELIHSMGDAIIADDRDNRELQSLLRKGLDVGSIYSGLKAIVEEEMLSDFSKDGGEVYVPRLVNTNFFKRVIRQFNQVANKETELRYVIHSAHDTDVSILSNFLNYTLNADLHYPEFASMINIELYQLEHSNFTVRIIFDDFELYEDSLENFTAKVEKAIFTSEEVTSFCAYDDFTLDMILKIIIICLSVVIFVLIIAAFYMYFKHRQFYLKLEEMENSEE